MKKYMRRPEIEKRTKYYSKLPHTIMKIVGTITLASAVFTIATFKSNTFLQINPNDLHKENIANHNITLDAEILDQQQDTQQMLPGVTSGVDPSKFAKVITVNGKQLKLPGQAWNYKGYDQYRTNSSHIFYPDDYLLGDESRGIGAFIEEDYSGKCADGHSYISSQHYGVVMRWEYVGFHVSGPDRFRNSLGADEAKHNDHIATNVISGHGKSPAPWGQRVLVYNPKNGKACVCQPNDWGPGPSARFGGLSEKAYKYLSPTVSNHTKPDEYLQAWFCVDKNTPLGPINFDPNSGGSGQSSSNPSSGGSNRSSLPKSSNGHTGQDVVDEAMKYLGNPYVWGGESLTNGCDCSGFTMLIYRKFGYSLPHSSSGQRSKGKKVNPDEKDMLPGDIICYDGHVAIYDGKGGIVHASNHKDGIKTSPSWNYRSVVCVRRMIN